MCNACYSGHELTLNIKGTGKSCVRSATTLTLNLLKHSLKTCPNSIWNRFKSSNQGKKPSIYLKISLNDAAGQQNSAVQSILKATTDLKVHLEITVKIANNRRILSSLNSFENYNYIMNNSQN